MRCVGSLARMPTVCFEQLQLNIATWLEWVDSDSNWSDGISRRGIARAWGVLPRLSTAPYMR